MGHHFGWTHVAIKEFKKDQISVYFPSTWREYNEVYCNNIEKRYKANKLLIYGIGHYECNKITTCESAKQVWERLRTAHEVMIQIKRY